MNDENTPAGEPEAAPGEVTTEEFIKNALEEIEWRKQGERFYTFYPSDGPLSLDKYPKHHEFFDLGAVKPFRLFLGGNGVGKTEGIGCFEATCHLTGIYPDWWRGIRYNKPIFMIVAGQTKENVRDIIQPKLIGRRGDYGTGMLPRELLPAEKIVMRAGMSGAVDHCYVQHVSGGMSYLGFKSYDMGADAFMGFEADVIWLDEEPPIEIYSECAQRFRTRRPCLFITFTPLAGISEVISMFLPDYAQEYDEDEYEMSGRAYISCAQDEVPHLTDEERSRLIANAAKHEREARKTGIPSIGAGKIYPYEESSFVIPPLVGGIPRHWPRVYGLDVGLRMTAALWLAHDRDTDIVYGYSEHYMGETLPPIHAQAIKARGVYIPGMIDPSARNRNPADAQRLMDIYTDKEKGLGLRLRKAENTVWTGITECQNRIETGRFKLYNTCTYFITEFRLYRRDKNGKIVKQKDHLMDAWRYAMMGLSNAAIPHDDDSRAPKTKEVCFYMSV